MMPNPVLESHDLEIRAAEAAIEIHRTTIRAAQALRAQLEDERRQASGRLATGDAAASPDLDRLIEEWVSARHAEQDAANACTAAQATVRPLQVARAAAAESEVIAHLTPLLADVRPAAARLITAHLQTLAAAVRLYLAVADESVRLAAPLAGRPGAVITHRDMEPFVARAVARLLVPVLGQKGPVSFTLTHHDPPLDESDLAITRGMREVLAGLAPPPAVAAEPTR
jgi:hypothetical protein